MRKKYPWSRGEERPWQARMPPYPLPFVMIPYIRYLSSRWGTKSTPFQLFPSHSTACNCCEKPSCSIPSSDSTYSNMAVLPWTVCLLVFISFHTCITPVA